MATKQLKESTGLTLKEILLQEEWIKKNGKPKRHNDLDIVEYSKNIDKVYGNSKATMQSSTGE